VTTAYWSLVNALWAGANTFAADGSQAVQSYLFNLPWLDFLYTSSGQLARVIFGPDLLSWDYSYFGSLTMVTLNGVLPSAVFVRTPQGQLLGGVQLVLSACGTPVVELLNPRGLAALAQPL
jgi:hypothetical protein